MFGLFKKKKEDPLPDKISTPMQAIVDAVAQTIKQQVSDARGWLAAGQALPDLGATDNFIVALYAYGFIDGCAQNTRALETWSKDNEAAAYQVMLMLALTKVFIDRTDTAEEIEAAAEYCGRLAGLVFKAEPWKYPKLIENGGKDG